MLKDLVVGELSTRSGEKIIGLNTFTVNGECCKLAAYLINGVPEGPTLILTGSVHAAEYASIAAALELGQSLDPQAIEGQIITLSVVNRPGLQPDRSMSTRWMAST